MKNSNFDFAKFSADAIRTVDSIRSQSSNGQPVSEKATESRVSALYRAIGLPAVRQPKKEDRLGNTNVLDPANNNNVFGTTLSADLFKQLATRETRFTSPITEEEIKNFLDINRSRLDDGFGFPDPGFGTQALRRRGPLLPLFVSAELKVLPQSKRVAGAFLNERQRTYGREIYRRPLIETFIIFSLKGIGAINETSQQRIREDFGFLNLDSFANLKQNLIDNIEAAKKSINPFVEQTIQLLDPARNVLGDNIVGTIGNIARGNPRTLPPESNTREFDIISENKRLKEEIRNSQLLLLEYDDDGVQDSLNSTKNARESILLSDFLQIVNTKDSERERKEQQEISSRRIKGNQTLKKAFSRLDLLLGTFSGLSGIDIIVIFDSLLAMETEFLLGLINQEAQARARSIYGSAMPQSVPSVISSTDVLLQIMGEKYKEIADNINQSVKHQDKAENRSDQNNEG